MATNVSYTGQRLQMLMNNLGMSGDATAAQYEMLRNNPTGALKFLQDGFSNCAHGFDAFQGGIPPFGAMPNPAAMMGVNGQLCGCGYHGGREKIDLAQGKSGLRGDAIKLERLLRTNDKARAAFESSIGGRITGFGRTDGKITIERFAPGFSPIPGMAQNPLANTALGSLAGMEQAIMAQAATLGLLSAGGGAVAGLATAGLTGGNPFMGLMLGGLGGLTANMMGAGTAFLGMPAMGGLGMGGGGLGLGGFGAFGGLLGGGGVGSWNPNAMPGHMQGTNPMFERAHQAQVMGVLNDPSLTVEDKVTLMLMLIMKKMDKDIERQAQYINSIQQQQSNRQGKGQALGKIGTVAGGALGGPAGAKIGGGLGGKLGGGGNSPSIDVETMKLKRMIDKRSQMFDMLRQIIDKYNETAKGIIQSIGR
jgi:hypothetical protein